MVKIITFPVGPLACNCTIIASETSGDAYIIDPGGDAARIARHLEGTGYKVAGIIHTHAHVDHIGATDRIRQLTKAPVLLHEKDLPVYRAAAMQAEWVGLPTPVTPPIDRYLEAGEMLEAGDISLEVLHTPGHTPGSVSFRLHGEDGRVFSGDTLFAGSVGRTDLPGGNWDQLLTSIHERLLPLPDGSPVVPGHGPSTTIGRERKSNPFLTGA